MVWTRIAAGDVNKVRYNSRRETLEIQYMDGSVAHAEGIEKDRFDQFLAAEPVDQGDYFRNLIAPYVVRHRSTTKHFSQTLRICMLVLAAGAVLWLIFTMSEFIRFS